MIVISDSKMQKSIGSETANSHMDSKKKAKSRVYTRDIDFRSKNPTGKLDLKTGFAPQARKSAEKVGHREKDCYIDPKEKTIFGSEMKKCVRESKIEGSPLLCFLL